MAGVDQPLPAEVELAEAIAAAMLEECYWSGVARRISAGSEPKLERRAEVSPRRLVADVARHFELDVGVLRGRDRTTQVVDARAVVVVLLRHWCSLSYPAIGRELARRHTTAMRAHARVRAYRRIGELAERVAKAIDVRTEPRGPVDVEAAFRRAREEAGGTASAQRDAPR